MKHKLYLYQRMLQRMSLTPQMRQSIQLLGMPTKELNEYIDSIVEKNPVLEKKFDRKSPVRIEKAVPREENPRVSLISQAKMLNLDDKALKIAEYLIYEMDDNGYIQINIEEAAEDLFVSVDEVEEVISVIRGMDPPGIGARDIRECLQLQLKRTNKEDSLEYNIVSNFINELATNDVEKISHALSMDKEEVLRAINNIKKLNPRPANTILSKGEEPVVPDLIASRKNNKIRLELNREWIPHLRLYNPYENKLDIVKDPEAREFLKNNMDEAKHLISNLKRREETMCRVADYILQFQKHYFENGLSQIKSLTIKDVGEALNLHPSTISRTVSSKYIQINDKVVPLKILLSHGIRNENGEIASKTSIKNRIRELADNEDKAKPLSDNKIQDVLEKEGINIKRRTVAKYRESLRILPTHLRRRKH